MHFVITDKDKEFLVSLISSLKTGPHPLMQTLRCYSGCQRDYLLWDKEGEYKI